MFLEQFFLIHAGSVFSKFTLRRDTMNVTVWSELEAAYEVARKFAQETRNFEQPGTRNDQKLNCSGLLSALEINSKRLRYSMEYSRCLTEEAQKIEKSLAKLRLPYQRIVKADFEICDSLHRNFFNSFVDIVRSAAAKEHKRVYYLLSSCVQYT